MLLCVLFSLNRLFRRRAGRFSSKFPIGLIIRIFQQNLFQLLVPMVQLVQKVGGMSKHEGLAEPSTLERGDHSVKLIKSFLYCVAAFLFALDVIVALLLIGKVFAWRLWRCCRGSLAFAG